MKMLYVTTVSSTMGFFTSHINMLLDQDHTVDLACNIIRPINEQLLKRGCKVHNIEFQRTPLDKRNYKAYKSLKKLIEKGNYDVVHTHTPIASSIVRLICKSMDNIKVFYTAHGFHFYKGAPPINWLIYYPIEKWLSRYTDVLITINNEDYKRAKESFGAKDIEYVPGVGLDINKFANAVIDKTTKKKELGLPENAFVVISIGELNKNKNHEVIIRAIARLGHLNIYYIICGQGPLESYLKDLAYKLGIQDKVLLLGYRKDIPEMLKAADIFAFPSKREGLGMAALEAMAAGLPIITSNIHGIVDYSIDSKTGFTFSPSDMDGFANAIERFYDNKTLKKRLSRQNIELIQKYSLGKVLEEMNKIYT